MAIINRQNDAGLTLIEILCVLTLLGLTTAIVVLSVPKEKDPFDGRINNYAAQLNVLQQNTVIDGKVRGMEIDKEGYDILLYSGEWSYLSLEDWGDVFNVTLRIQDEEIDFNARKKVLDQAEDTILPPLVFFDPLEGVTDFELGIETRDKTYQLSPDNRGKITVSIRE